MNFGTNVVFSKSNNVTSIRCDVTTGAINNIFRSFCSKNMITQNSDFFTKRTIKVDIITSKALNLIY